MKKYLLLFLAMGLSFTACKKSDDGFTSPDPPNPDPGADVIVQDFMWSAMNLWYFWQADVPDLADTKFPNTTEGSKAYTSFLLSESDPSTFYNKKLLFNEDRFSFYSEDYKELTQLFAGISKSNGVEFGLIRLSGSDDIFGFVRYIIPGSDAVNKNISRGELFNGVNGQTLTLSNFVDLLFGESDTYTLNMANFVNGAITSSDKDVTLTKMPGLVENPVFLDKTFTIDGKKIGYLVYNVFTNEFDEDLNNVFGRFKSEGVTELVLDMRYNPGGSVNTARLLSSMIYGTDTDEVFLKAKYNTKYQSYLNTNNVDVKRYFADKTDKNTPINTLNLTKIYVLALGSSASASELVMNGLAPYVNIVHIGEATRGKNEFSTTLVDDPDNSYLYSAARENRINSKNIWAIQPLIGRNENADGFSDYTDGLIPNIELKEDLANLGVLGDLNEPLLARAIQEITGTSAKMDFTVQIPAEVMTSSKMFTPLKDNMYIDLPATIDFH
ncbi:MAG: S41 family peptidase [Flavobacteriaceae bacterium]